MTTDLAPRPVDALRKMDLTNAKVWASPSVRKRALSHIKADPFDPQKTPAPEILVGVGGGTLLDQAKAWRKENAPQTKLYLIPSLWGSAAESVPIVVLNNGEKKDIRIDDGFLPDAVFLWPELADSVPEELARFACGDAWAHALEALLSPLATPEIQEEAAEVIRSALALPIGNDGRWFEASARAGQAQAKSSVGLVHGVAHTLEGPLKTRQPDERWSHAKLCSIFLKPVMLFNKETSPKWGETLNKFGLKEDAVFGKLDELFDATLYRRALIVLKEKWDDVIRDRCSRTNSALVRPDSLSFFDQDF